MFNLIQLNVSIDFVWVTKSRSINGDYPQITVNVLLVHFMRIRMWKEILFFTCIFQELLNSSRKDFHIKNISHCQPCNKNPKFHVFVTRPCSKLVWCCSSARFILIFGQIAKDGLRILLHKGNSIEVQWKFQALFCGRYTAKILNFKLSFQIQYLKNICFVSKNFKRWRLWRKTKTYFLYDDWKYIKFDTFLLIFTIAMLNPWK